MNPNAGTESGLTDKLDKDAILVRVADAQIAYVDLQFTDITGVIKTVQIPARQLEAAFTDGIWFDGSALQGFARVVESDMYLRPDPATFAILPWEQADRPVARLICDVHTPTGEPFSGDPRAVLKRAISAAREMNYRYIVSPELEFYLFRQPMNGQISGQIDTASLQTEDHASYFDMSDTLSRTVRRAISDALDQMGIQVDSGHHEVGFGQHEIDFAPLDALEMADAVMTARQAVKNVAQQHGLYATFMPKPIAGIPGSGMHIHQLLRDTFNGSNAFANSSDDYGLSATARSFLAGQLQHARGICAVLAPLVNSYKRLTAGQEAPVYVTWAQLNRSALIRVPRNRTPLNPDRQGTQNTQTRIELRCVDPSCNPYLGLAVMLRAGLDGISQAMELPRAAEEELYTFNNRRHQITTLPTSLSEALSAMEQSDLCSDALGLNVYERFLEAKRMEWSEYILEVSPWELQRYLTIY